MMIARIRKKDIVYDSVVFAVSYKLRKSKIVVFDESYSKLIVIEYSYNSEIDVMFLNYDYSKYKINDENYKVYWNDKNFFKLVENQNYSLEMLDEAKKLQSAINYQEWYEIKNEDDLKGLIFSVGDFHDACIIKILETNDYLEILIDTTWGSYVMLKCYDVIENQLDLNYYFFDCSYTFNNEIIEINFNDEFIDPCILKCKKIVYRYFFEKRCNVKNYEIKNDYLIFNHNKADELKINLLEVEQKIFSTNDRINVGMKKYFSNLSTYTFVLKDFFIVARFCPMKVESEEQFKSRVTKLEKSLLEEGLNLYKIYQDDLFINNQEKFGNVLFQEEYRNLKDFLYMLKYYSIPLYGNVLFWLIIKLCSSQMKWMMFWIFGIGITLIAFLIFLIAYCFNYKGSKNTLTLYEDGFVCNGMSLACSVSYSTITNVEFGKRIIVTTGVGKYKLLKSKNNERIYEIIEQRIQKIDK